MADWYRMSEKPTRPLHAEVFYGRLYFEDEKGRKVSAIIEPYRDERRALAYYDGREWHEMGTGHRLDEFESDPRWCATHWRPLGPIPKEFR